MHAAPTPVCPACHSTLAPQWIFTDKIIDIIFNKRPTQVAAGRNSVFRGTAFKGCQQPTDWRSRWWTMIGLAACARQHARTPACEPVDARARTQPLTAYCPKHNVVAGFSCRAHSLQRVSCGETITLSVCRSFCIVHCDWSTGHIDQSAFRQSTLPHAFHIRT